MISDQKIEAVYNGETGKIGCVLIQAGMGGNSTIASLFDPDDWELAPAEGQALMAATLEQWQMIADMSRADRIARWNRG